MLASVRSAVLRGVDGQLVTVEVHVSRGLPGYTVVGLPDAAGRESRERVRAAYMSCGFEWPQKRVTVNLAPADVRKTGSALELAVAVSVMAADELLPADALDGLAILGELGLDGRVRSVPGVLVLIDALAYAGVGRVIVPLANAAEAALVPNIEVRPARTLAELRACLKAECPWPDVPPSPPATNPCDDDPVDLCEVRGLPIAQHALAIAAAGAHHLLFVGSPGVGKTMLARRLPTILPPLARDEALEVTKIRSAAGLGSTGVLCTARPFRAPHHSATMPALIGGGSPQVRPGEISLSHRGSLFLDELAEFPPPVLDALRQPLEERVVRVSRAAGTFEFPADFLLVACCNPCPCGRPDPKCMCTDMQRARYLRRLSAPLMDRFDLRLEVGASDPDAAAGEESEVVAARVAAALARQQHRYMETPWRRNAHVAGGALPVFMPLDRDVESAWRALCRTRRLSGRGAARVRRVARTIADLDERPDVTADDIELAGMLREDVR
ncbi:MAG TPA: YifB family Mg chelatase-like AAA ATPase [Acidimicrobiia bacterium]|nr:YifB family Mg chelatase-like AAA ATPase [Acidimicrobiia bacterium]